jgi:hypothetical protein
LISSLTFGHKLIIVLPSTAHKQQVQTTSVYAQLAFSYCHPERSEGSRFFGCASE